MYICIILTFPLGFYPHLTDYHACIRVRNAQFTSGFLIGNVFIGVFTLCFVGVLLDIYRKFFFFPIDYSVFLLP